MSTTFTDGTGTATPGGLATGYPVTLTITRQASYNRFFAIPLIGLIARSLLLIPHLIALYIVGIVNLAIHLVAWIPVLTGGTYPHWAFNWTSGTIRWAVRVFAYFYGLTDRYPPFSLGASDDYPVQVNFEYPSNPSRFFAIPLLGVLARYVLLIPHLIVIYALYYVVGAFQLVTWAPVLFGGQYPEWGESFIGGFLRWSARVYAYLFGLSDKYPPFALGN